MTNQTNFNNIMKTYLSKVLSKLNDSGNNSEVLRKRAVKWLSIIGVVFIVFGLSVVILFPIILKAIMEWQMVIKEGNIFTWIWAEPPVGITIKMYLWSLENPDEFRRGAKPRMKQMGPYAYDVWAKHEILGWGAYEETVKFAYSATLYHNPSATKGALNDRITMLNPVVYAAAGTTRNILAKIPFSFTVAPIVYAFMSAFFLAHGEGVIKETTAKDFIEGKYMPIVGTANFFLKPLKWLGIGKWIPEVELVDQVLRDNKFGIVHAINGSKIGPYEMYTGVHDYSKFNKFVSVRGKTHYNVWDDPHCNEWNGTEGVTFGFNVKKEDKLHIFLGDLCRSLYANYQKFTLDRFIPAWRFEIKDMFAGPQKVPDNTCFCNTPNDYDMCDGIYDIGPCQWQVPISLSLPHLLHTSYKIQSGVEGISPDPEKHSCYLDFNHIIGSPIGGMVRIQVNLIVKPISTMIGVSDLPDVIYPFIWLEVDGSAGTLFDILLVFGIWALYLVYYGPYFLVLLGLFLVFISTILSLKKSGVPTQPKRETTPLEVFDQMDRQMELKANQMYPNLFNEDSDDLIRPIHRPIQRGQEVNNISRSVSQISVRRTPVLNGHPIDITVTPPGSL